MQAALWILSLLLMAAGLAGTVLPALPGIVLVFAGIVLGAWIDDFTRVGGWALSVITLMAKQGIPIWRAAITSGTVLMPTASPPMMRT